MTTPQTSASAYKVLSEAESRSRMGRYDDALGILERNAGAGAAAEKHSAYWMGMVCAAAARNKLRMQDDQGALQYLRLVSPELRDANPKIDAECHTVRGILHRRDAYRDWKAQRQDSAMLKVELAIGAFQLAQASAQMALEDRILHNAALNRLYAYGLRLALLGHKREQYAELVCEAIVAEAASRDSTPPCVRDDLTGLTMIADLARGGGIGLDDVPGLSGDPVFVQAARQIVGCYGTTWAGLILETVREAHPGKTDVVAGALILGTTLLRTDPHESGAGLFAEYAARLRVTYHDLGDAVFHAPLRERVLTALAGLPPEIARMAMAPTFLR